MIYFKDLNNKVYAFETIEQQQEHKPELTQLTAVELERHLNPIPTQAELDAKAKAEADKARSEAMLTGFEYNGVMVSVTSDDGNALTQLKSAFELGLTDTVIHFENGTKLPMTASDFSAFALLFVTERNKFFTN